MGQSQLLLIVLGVVIVALAVVVGLILFSENRAEAASDELIATSTRIASHGIPWTLSAAPLGGGGGDPTGISFDRMGYDEETDGSYRSGDGVYTIEGTSARFVIRGEIAQTGFYAVTAVFGPYESCVRTVGQYGTAPAEPTAPAGCTW